MKKRILSAFLAGITAAMFTILYPEYLFLPGTYQYIKEKNGQTGIFSEMREPGLYGLLHATTDEIEISSGILEFLADEGFLLWKNNNSDKMDMQ